MDADWKWTEDYRNDDGTLGSNYEKDGPYGKEEKQVKRDRHTGRLVLDVDLYRSGRRYADHDDGDGDGHPNEDEQIMSRFYYRTGRLGEMVDGFWNSEVFYSGDDAALDEATFKPERLTVSDLDRIVKAMRKRSVGGRGPAHRPLP